MQQRSAQVEMFRVIYHMTASEKTPLTDDQAIASGSWFEIRYQHTASRVKHEPS